VQHMLDFVGHVVSFRGYEKGDTAHAANSLLL